MSGKTVPLSVRVNDDDAAFLAGMEIAGATTPSEKLRALLAAERRRREGAQDPDEAAEFFADMLRGAQRRLRRVARDNGLSSDFVTELYERLPEITGTAFAAPPESEGHDLTSRLRDFEARLLDQVFALFEETLKLGLLSRARCYDPQAIAARLGPVLELVELIRLSEERRRKGAE